MTCMIVLEHKGVISDRIREAAAIAGVDDITVVGTVDDANRVFDGCTPQVLAIGPSVDISDATRIARSMRESKGTATVFVADRADATLFRAAMRAGIQDVLTNDNTIDEIAESFKRAQDAAKPAQALLGVDSSPTGEEVRHGELITVFSTKGGVGKTVLATNLGVALARDTGASVCLIDLDLEFGDVGIMLGIKPERTIADLMQGFDRLDEELLAAYMTDHDSGLKVLLAPVSPEDAETISATRVSRILDLLLTMYDFVVVDTSPSFTETVLAALDKSSAIYVLTMMDVASIKNTRISMQKLKQLGYNSGDVRVVLNRADSKVLLEAGEVDEAIGGEVVARIPSDRIVPRSVNKGVPVIVDMPKSPVAKSILGLAKTISEVEGREAHDVA